MEQRHQRRTRDCRLRLAGAALCCVAWAAIRTLVHIRLADATAAPGALAFALATLGFIAASAGTGLCALGIHILDPVAVSERWR